MRPYTIPPLDARAAAAERPGIAVLPFANMSGDPEQEYFADGMVEEIVTGLARIRWLTVIARNSTFARFLFADALGFDRITAGMRTAAGMIRTPSSVFRGT